MSRKKQRLSTSTYNIVIIRGLQLTAVAVSLFSFMALWSQFFGDGSFLDHDLALFEIAMLLGSTVFAWAFVAAYSRWARFLG